MKLFLSKCSHSMTSKFLFTTWKHIPENVYLNQRDCDNYKNVDETPFVYHCCNTIKIIKLKLKIFHFDIIENLSDLIQNRLSLNLHLSASFLMISLDIEDLLIHCVLFAWLTCRFISEMLSFISICKSSMTSSASSLSKLKPQVGSGFPSTRR